MISREKAIQTALRSAAFTQWPAIGLIRVHGADRIDLLHRLSTNDLSRLQTGATLGTVFTTEKGKIIDAVHLAAFENTLLMVCSTGREHELLRWLDKYTITEDFKASSVTGNFICISLIGPNTLSMAGEWCGTALRPDQCITARIDGAIVHVLAVSGPLGPAVRALVESNAGEAGVRMLRDRAHRMGLPELDEEAWESYRILSGVPASAGELIAAHTPYDAGLRDLISFTKGCYIGQEVIARLDTYQKVRRSLVGAWSSQAAVAAPEERLRVDGEEVGHLTSVGRVAVEGRWPALAIVRTDRVQPGDTCTSESNIPWVLAHRPGKPWGS